MFPFLCFVIYNLFVPWWYRPTSFPMISVASSRASPGWAHSTCFIPPLWGSAQGIVTGSLDLSLHNPQRQKPCFVYFCVSHNPWHAIGIQMFAWMDESVNKWTDLPLPGTRRLNLVLSHSARHPNLNCSCARGSADRHEPGSTRCESRWQAGHLLQTSPSLGFSERLPRSLIVPSECLGAMPLATFCSYLPFKFKGAAPGLLYWDL